MSRSFVVGKRNSRVVFGVLVDGFAVADGVCADAVINEQLAIASERQKKRGRIFMVKKRSEQSAVEPLGCNSDFLYDKMPYAE